jgi:hypothetical protein
MLLSKEAVGLVTPDRALSLVLVFVPCFNLIDWFFFFIYHIFLVFGQGRFKRRSRPSLSYLLERWSSRVQVF